MGTHSLPCNCVPSGQTQEFGAAPEIIGGGQMQEFGVAPAIIGGGQSFGTTTHWLRCKFIPSGQTQEFGVGPGIIGGVQGGPLMPAWAATPNGTQAPQ